MFRSSKAITASPIKTFKLLLNHKQVGLTQAEKMILNDFYTFRKAYQKSQYPTSGLFTKTPSLQLVDIPEVINAYCAHLISQHKVIPPFLIQRLYPFFMSYPNLMTKLNPIVLNQDDFSEEIYTKYINTLAQPIFDTLFHSLSTSDERYPNQTVLDQLTHLMTSLPYEKRYYISVKLIEIIQTSKKSEARMNAAVILAKLISQIPESKHEAIYQVLENLSKDINPFLQAVACFTLTLIAASSASFYQNKKQDLMTLTARIKQSTAEFPSQIAHLCHAKLAALSDDKKYSAELEEQMQQFFYAESAKHGIDYAHHYGLVAKHTLSDSKNEAMTKSIPWQVLPDPFVRAICYELSPQAKETKQEQQLPAMQNLPQTLQTISVLLPKEYATLLLKASKETKEIPEFITYLHTALGMNKMHFLIALFQIAKDIDDNTTRFTLVKLISEFYLKDKVNHLITNLGSLPATISSIVLEYSHPGASNFAYRSQ